MGFYGGIPFRAELSLREGGTLAFHEVKFYACIEKIGWLYKYGCPFKVNDEPILKCKNFLHFNYKSTVSSSANAINTPETYDMKVRT